MGRRLSGKNGHCCCKVSTCQTQHAQAAEIRIEFKLNNRVKRRSLHASRHTELTFQLPNYLVGNNRRNVFLDLAKRPPETGDPGVRKDAVRYSAATLRGGSSAPESWISAT